MLELAIFCAALNVYHESRGEPVKGQYAVALVTVNRAGRDPKRVCPEVVRPHQFSWTTDHVVPVKGGYRLRPTGVPKDPIAWDAAVQIAESVLRGRVPDFTKGATHFHTQDVNPYWNARLQKVAAIGRHIFYR